MRFMRLGLMVCLVLALAGCGGGNKDKIQGKWECTEPELAKGTLYEFTGDGKAKMTILGVTVDGKYEVDGDNLKTTFTDANKKEETKTAKIKSVTDQELVLEGEGQTMKFKKK